MRGELRRRETIHWEDPMLRAMFPRNITPSDWDGWCGFADLGGRYGGPLSVFELKRGYAPRQHGQEEAFAQLRWHLPATDWWIRVLHSARGDDVWARDFGRWEAYPCGGQLALTEQGEGAESLAAFVSSLDGFGRLPRWQS